MTARAGRRRFKLHGVPTGRIGPMPLAHRRAHRHLTLALGTRLDADLAGAAAHRLAVIYTPGRGDVGVAVTDPVTLAPAAVGTEARPRHRSPTMNASRFAPAVRIASGDASAPAGAAGTPRSASGSPAAGA